LVVLQGLICGQQLALRVEDEARDEGGPAIRMGGFAKVFSNRCLSAASSARSATVAVGGAMAVGVVVEAGLAAPPVGSFWLFCFPPFRPFPRTIATNCQCALSGKMNERMKRPSTTREVLYFSQGGGFDREIPSDQAESMNFDWA
jgi:hypothetical protein